MACLGLRASFAVLLALAVAPAAMAGPQSPIEDLLRPITCPIVRVRYDTSSGSVVPASLSSGSSGTVVYKNTCPTWSPTYIPFCSASTSGGSQAEAWVDEGRVPGPTSPDTISSKPGCASSYSIDGFSFAYCTTTGAPVDVNIQFWQPVGLCENPFQSGAPLLASFQLTGLPASPGAGTLACFTVDVAGFPAFAIAGADSERFGWSIQLPLTADEDGALLAGDPGTGGCSRWAGTLWDPVQPSNGEGTGMGSLSLWVLEDFGGGNSGCYFLGHDFSSFYLELRSSDPCPLGLPFCVGTSAACPCGNGDGVATGCDNAQATGGVRLEAVAFQPDGGGGGDADLTGAGFPPAGQPTVVLIRSQARENPPVPFGDGLRCIALAGLVRLGATTAVGGASAHHVSHGAGAGTFAYQLWYRNNPASFCTPSAFNLSNGYELDW